MKRIIRLGILVTLFSFIVSCCFRTVPPISDSYKHQNESDVPLDPQSVLFIHGLHIPTGGQIMGSAIIIESNESESIALSAGHVCYPEDEPYASKLDEWAVLAIDISGEPMPMKQIGLDLVNDICVFKIPISTDHVTSIAETMPVIGHRVYLGAYPHGVYMPGTLPLFEGFYSGSAGNKAEYTIPVAPGSSGGGIVNSQGELIGIVSMALVEFENLVLAVKLNDIQNLLDAVRKNPDRLTIIR